MRHRSAIKRRSKQRYRRVRNTGAYRHHAQMRRQNPNRFRRFHSATATPLRVEFWTLSWGVSCVIAVEGDRILFVEAGEEVRSMHYEEFLSIAHFFDDGDIDILFGALDLEMEVSPEVALRSDQEVQVSLSTNT